MTLLRTCAVAAVLAGLIACPRATPQLAPLAPDAVVLAFGDSLTAGTGAEERESYPAVLSGLIGRRVINAGIPGEVSEEGLRRLPQVLDDERPALLILCHGGNDMLRQRDRTALAGNLRAMVQLARDRGIAAVLVGVPAPGIARTVPDLYPALAREFKLPFDGETLPEIEGDRSLKSDPVHPNAAGYRLLAQRIARLLKEAGAI